MGKQRACVCYQAAAHFPGLQLLRHPRETVAECVSDTACRQCSPGQAAPDVGSAGAAFAAVPLAWATVYSDIMPARMWSFT